MREDLQELREEKAVFFKNHPQSPLTPEQRKRFTELSYFPFNPSLDLELTPHPYDNKQQVKMLTTTGETRYYQRWGYVSFEVEGVTLQLTLYAAPGQPGFFLPFMDATSGDETYGSGRYLDITRLPDGNIHLDFNVAYNPYCAYNEPPALAAEAGRDPRIWNCPIPPKENRLTAPIRAGEMKPVGDWVIQNYD